MDIAVAPRSNTSIFLLSIAAFAIMTTEFIILGILPEIAKDLNISISYAGQLATLFAVVVMVLGPLLTPMFATVDRKKVFVSILLIFSLANGIAAIAHTYWVLAVSRVIAAAALPVFWGLASETATKLARTGEEGKSVAKLYLGIAAGFVLGIPLGTSTAHFLGWRGSFALLALFCLIFAFLISWCMPKIKAIKLTDKISSWSDILQDRFVIAHLLLTVVSYAAMFSTYTYLTDTLERVSEVPPDMISLYLFLFGGVGFIGNIFGGRLAESGATKATIRLSLLLAVGMVMTTLSGTNTGLLCISLTVWGIAFTALFPVGQVRVLMAAQQSKALAGTLNVSAANAGIAIGAAIGGGAIEMFGLYPLSFIGAGLGILNLLFATSLIKQGRLRGMR